MLWNPQGTAFSTVGGQFAFTITGPANAVLVVQATANLAGAGLNIATNTLTGGIWNFTDPQSSNYPQRFYRFLPQPMAAP